MSWRLWYRESALKESERTAASTCPIPIQQSKTEADKHLSPTSFKRIISSLNENKIIAQPTKSSPNESLIQFEKPVSSKPIKKAHSYIENTKKAQLAIKTCQSTMEVSQLPAQNKRLHITNTQPINPINKQQAPIVTKKPQEERSKFFIKEEEEQDWSSDDEDEDATPKNSVDFVERTVEINNDADHNESAFLSEFRKRSPPPISIIAKRSILSNMLQNETNTRLARPNLVAQKNQQHEQLSSSLTGCLRRERQGLGYDISPNSNIKLPLDGLENTFYGYW